MGKIDTRLDIPNINRVFLPKLDPNKPVQPKNERFMVIQLEGGAVGICHTLIPPEFADKYNKIKKRSIIGNNPYKYSLNYGSDDPVDKVIALCSINAICQHTMKQVKISDVMNFTSDSTGNLKIHQNDKVGMVGLFIPLVKTIEKLGAELVVLEKREELVELFPKLNVILDPNGIQKCNKILCTSTTLLNNTLEEVLSNCNPEAKISIIGPTAGYFPDPLFKLNVNVVGGTIVVDNSLFFENIIDHKRWGSSTRKYCFEKDFYSGIDKILSKLE
jgi:uncharacterized protein (DUF4213/DUF364 family)